MRSCAEQHSLQEQLQMHPCTVYRQENIIRWLRASSLLNWQWVCLPGLSWAEDLGDIFRVSCVQGVSSCSPCTKDHMGFYRDSVRDLRHGYVLPRQKSLGRARWTQHIFWHLSLEGTSHQSRSVKSFLFSVCGDYKRG